jgi:hypothetical protein
MKLKSVFLVVTTAAVGFAFVTPEASAHLRKSMPGQVIHNHAKQGTKAKSTRAEAKASAKCSNKKPIGFAVKKDTKKLRPYFERKRGAPAVSRRK